MEATIDFDIVCHLGFFKSLDMRERGFYFIEMTLDYITNSESSISESSLTIAPIGCFSAPSTLNSNVRSTTINPAILVHVCHIEDRERAFQSHSFLIRYRDEVHELNDGCHWRVSLQNMPVIHENMNSMTLPTLGSFVINFKLMKADIEIDFEKVSKFQFDFDTEVNWSICSHQSLQLQDVVKGLHEYFPVRFDRYHFVDMDCMIHAAVTGIRYTGLQHGDSPVIWKNRELDLSASLQDMYVSPSVDPAISIADAGLSFKSVADLAVTSAETSSPVKMKDQATSALDKIITPLKGISKGLKLPSSQDLDVNRFLFHEEDYQKSDSGTEPVLSNATDESIAQRSTTSTTTEAASHQFSIKQPRNSYEPNSSQTGTTPGKAAGSTSNRPQRKSFSPAKDTSLPMDSNDTTVTPQKNLSEALDSIHDAMDEVITGAFTAGNSRRTTLVNREETRPVRRSLSSSPTQRVRKTLNNDNTITQATGSASGIDTGARSRKSSPIREQSKHLPSAGDRSPTGRHRLLSDRSKGSHALWRKHADPIIYNFNLVIRGINQLFNKIENSVTNQSAPSTPKPSESSFVVLDEITLRELDLVESSEQFQDLLFTRIAQSNSYLSRKWTLFVASLPQYMPQLVSKMKSAYVHIIKRFWKRQLYVHFASLQFAQQSVVSTNVGDAATNIWKVCGDEDIIAFLNNLVGYNPTTNSQSNQSTQSISGTEINGSEIANAKKNVSLKMQADSAIALALSTQTRSPKKFAHGLKVFDTQIHKDVSKLPFILLQQYTSQTLSPKPFYPNDGIVVRGGELLNCKDDAGEYNKSSIYNIQDVTSLSRGRSDLRIASQSRSESVRVMSSPIKQLTSSLDATSFDDSVQHNQSESMNAELTPRLPDTTSDLHGSSSHTLSKPDPAAEIDHSISDETNVHLVILQHGFLGFSHDMKLLSHALSVEGAPHVHTYIACSNDDHNDDGIGSMADRLASEIYSYFSSTFPFLLEESEGEGGGHSDGRVSFIGHSMGGLVIRKALENKKLKPIRERLHTYISLATPHLGTVYSDSQLVSVGQWALSKFKKTSALKELALQDAFSLTKTTIYQLSENNVLGDFQHVVFVSSPKDMYVPRYSASVRMNYESVSSGSSNSKQMLDNLKTMCDNVLNQVNPDRLVRVTIENNEGDDKSLNTTIGRTAHICYLDNPIVATQLIFTLLPLLT